MCNPIPFLVEGWIMQDSEVNFPKDEQVDTPEMKTKWKKLKCNKMIKIWLYLKCNNFHLSLKCNESSFLYCLIVNWPWQRSWRRRGRVEGMSFLGVSKTRLPCEDSVTPTSTNLSIPNIGSGAILLTNLSRKALRDFLTNFPHFNSQE